MRRMLGLVFAFGVWAALGAEIGVFDSGIGGLTVLEKLVRREELAGEDFAYLGDQANMPYGDYAAAGKSDMLKELIWNDVQFLLKRKPKMIVIACNTATAWGLDMTRERLKAANNPIPVIGVIEAGVKGTLRKPHSAEVAIGVLATPGTIASGVYERMLRRQGFRGKVVSQGCAGLADAVEAGSAAADEIAASNLTALVKANAAANPESAIGRIILGCTHYPFVLGALQKRLAELKASGYRFTADFSFEDPAEYTAEECARMLGSEACAARPPCHVGCGKVSAYISAGENSLRAGRITPVKYVEFDSHPLLQNNREYGIIRGVLKNNNSRNAARRSGMLNK